MKNYRYDFCSLIVATNRLLEKIRMENKNYAKVGYFYREEKKYMVILL